MEKPKKMMNEEVVDEETSRMTERSAVLRIATKHINLWTRQLEMKRKEIAELAELMGFDEDKKEIANEKSLERRAKRCSHHFTKKVKRMLFEEIYNMMWSGREKEIISWREMNKVYDEITENEIEDIWNREAPDHEEPIRLNGKFVWETAKRVCDFINAREGLIRITTFGEYRTVLMKVMMVIRETNLVERKRRRTTRNVNRDEINRRTQRAKTLIVAVRQGGMRKEEIERRLEDIFGRGSSKEIEHAATKEAIAERIEELAKTDEQFETWEKMRREYKKRQREDRRLNLFWRRNKTFPKQYGGEDETPDTEDTLMFWRNIKNKDASDGWRVDESIQEVLREVRGKVPRRCSWGHSRKRNLTRSSGTRPPGRRAGLTAYTPSLSRGACLSRRRCTSWSRRRSSGRLPTGGTRRTTGSSKGAPSSSLRAETGKTQRTTAL